MSMWNKPLTRENFDEFFRLFAAPAYRSTYRILGDTTRTENALTESFLEVYHQRNSESSGDLVFLFSDILQKRVETLASHYPVTMSIQAANRALDEFTENSILAELHRRIDSTPYRILEIFTSSVGKTSSQADSFLGQFHKSGLSLFLIFQLIIVAVIIFAITYTSATKIFGINDLAPQSPENAELLIDDVLVPAMNYLPLTVSGQTAAAETTETGLPTDAAGQPVTGSDTTTVSSAPEVTAASATRG